MTYLLREARERAGLTQAELAERSGVAQSTISAYESGRRDPGWRVLMKLVDAAGYGLTLRGRTPSPEEAGRTLFDAMQLAHTIKRASRGTPRVRRACLTNS